MFEGQSCVRYSGMLSGECHAGEREVRDGRDSVSLIYTRVLTQKHALMLDPVLDMVFLDDNNLSGCFLYN